MLAAATLAPFHFAYPTAGLAKTVANAFTFHYSTATAIDALQNVLLFAGWGALWATTTAPTPLPRALRGPALTGAAPNPLAALTGGGANPLAMLGQVAGGASSAVSGAADMAEGLAALPRQIAQLSELVANLVGVLESVQGVAGAMTGGGGRAPAARKSG